MAFSKYRPAFCKKAIDAGIAGKTITQFACELGVTRQTLHNWEREFPDFKEALERMNQHAQAKHEELIMAAISGDLKIDAGLMKWVMAVRFKDYAQAEDTGQRPITVVVNTHANDTAT